MIDAMRAEEIILGMPADAVMAFRCPATGVEEYVEHGRRIQRLTWGISNRAADRVVVTIEDGVVTGIRRGMGTAEDMYR